MRKTKLTAICNKCGKIDSRDCLHCKEIKKLFRQKEKKHDILYHDQREWDVTAEKELATKAVQEEAAKKVALAAAEVDNTGLENGEEENSSTTELAKVIRGNITADEVRKQFKDKHVFRNHEDRLWRLFNKFIDCWSITKISKASKDSKQNLQKLFQLRIKKLIAMNNKTSNTDIITPDKFKKKLHL